MFENITQYDKAAVWAMTCASTRKFQRKRYLLRKCFYAGMGLLGTLCGLLLLFIFETLDFGERLICFMTLAVCVPGLLKGLLLRRFMAWSAGRILRKAKRSLEHCFSFSEESFRCTQSNIETVYQYGTIQEICETEGHFVLRLDAQSGVVLDKAGFTSGTADGFRAFLEQKLGKTAERVK